MVLFYCHFPWKLSSFNALDPQTYGGDLMIHAAFANTEYKLKKINCSTRSSRRTNYSKVQWNTQLGAIGEDQLDKTAFYQV
jgi:hypothetical protein